MVAEVFYLPWGKGLMKKLEVKNLMTLSLQCHGLIILFPCWKFETVNLENYVSFKLFFLFFKKFEDYLSALGGILGLYTGASIISIIEVFLFFPWLLWKLSAIAMNYFK